ncbi:hypothetical protein QBC44DRAFT_340677 [Cladorrhinum sp. PSN332]|nr:hypothetical protein QBC44DRAFT_340677 [Cladorrhinum sp. PSN332]
MASNPDIVIAGSGMAGICAAIAAAECGVRGRRHTPENMYKYLRQELGLADGDAATPAVDDATLKNFCDESVARNEWLEQHGAVFASQLCPFKVMYPPGKYGLYFSGNEKAHPFASVAAPAPRGHRTAGKGMTGNVLWEALFASVLKLGVVFQAASRVQEILVTAEGGGGVKGVRYKSLETTSEGYAKYKKLAQCELKYRKLMMEAVANWYNSRAEKVWLAEAKEKTITTKAVVLAAGGYVMNKEMVEKYAPFAKHFIPVATVGDDGSGIQLGQSVGGALTHMDRLVVGRFLSPPTAFMEGAAVSPGGERIAAEDLHGMAFGEAMRTKHDGNGFLVLDAVQWRKSKQQLGEQAQWPMNLPVKCLLYWPWVHKKAKNLASLSFKIGVPEVALRKTVGSYNAAIAEGKPDPANKLEYRSAIERAPFYAIDISFRRTGLQFVTGFTIGGLKVDGGSGIVLNGNGEGIAGVYAAGRNAAGICSQSVVSGLSLADGVFSGKRAGGHAARAVLGAKGAKGAV